jgi:hypothetical protein
MLSNKNTQGASAHFYVQSPLESMPKRARSMSEPAAVKKPKMMALPLSRRELNISLVLAEAQPHICHAIETGECMRHAVLLRQWHRGIVARLASPAPDLRDHSFSVADMFAS